MCSTDSMDELKSNQNVLFHNSVIKFRDLEHRVQHKSKEFYQRNNNPTDLCFAKYEVD